MTGPSSKHVVLSRRSALVLRASGSTTILSFPGTENMYRIRDVASRGVKFGTGRVAGASNMCIPMSSSRAA